MKLPKKALFLSLMLSNHAFADIYGYTEEDGTVVLSNVPTSSQFKKIVSSRQVSPKMEQSQNIEKLISTAAKNFSLDAALLHAVVSVESRYNPKAISKKGAVGLMQLMPDTARRYGVTDRYDPEQNIRGGAHYLKDLLLRFNGNLSLALAAYNAGEDAVIRCGYCIPAYPETTRYVPRVLSSYRKFSRGT